MINKTISKNLQNKLSTTFYSKGIWGTTDYAHELPAGMERGSDIHLAYLTLVYTVSGGQDPESVWHAAKQTFEHDPELFDPKYLAYIKPKEILDRLNVYGMLYKATPEATVWQRIGQGMVMRAKGSVQALLAASDFDAQKIMAMLQKSKRVFPVLSGTQTAPRWLYGLTINGGQKISGADQLFAPPSPAGKRASVSLKIETSSVPVSIFAPLDALGRNGCRQRKKSQPICPVSVQCAFSKECIHKS